MFFSDIIKPIKKFRLIFRIFVDIFSSLDENTIVNVRPEQSEKHTKIMAGDCLSGNGGNLLFR